MTDAAAILPVPFPPVGRGPIAPPPLPQTPSPVADEWWNPDSIPQPGRLDFDYRIKAEHLRKVRPEGWSASDANMLAKMAAHSGRDAYSASAIANEIVDALPRSRGYSSTDQARFAAAGVAVGVNYHSPWIERVLKRVDRIAESDWSIQDKAHVVAAAFVSDTSPDHVERTVKAFSKVGDKYLSTPELAGHIGDAIERNGGYAHWDAVVIGAVDKHALAGWTHDDSRSMVNYLLEHDIHVGRAGDALAAVANAVPESWPASATIPLVKAALETELSVRKMDQVITRAITTQQGSGASTPDSLSRAAQNALVKSAYPEHYGMGMTGGWFDLGDGDLY